MIEQLTETPEGFIDIPFFYVFDARGLTDGANYQDLGVALQDDEFILRSVVGVDSVAESWQYRNDSSAMAMSRLVRTDPRHTVAPEKRYHPQGQIAFDLDNVSRATNVSNNFVSFIGFQGVRRAPEDNAPYLIHTTPYDYWEKNYTYLFDLTLDFYADQGAGARGFEVNIENYDFELQAIYIRRTDPSDSGLLADPFLIQMYDCSGYYTLSNVAHPARWINYGQGGRFFSVFPVPSIVYSNTGVIRFDIVSLLDQADGPQSFEFAFVGMSRHPC